MIGIIDNSLLHFIIKPYCLNLILKNKIEEIYVFFVGVIFSVFIFSML